MFKKMFLKLKDCVSFLVMSIFYIDLDLVSVRYFIFIFIILEIIVFLDFW